MRSHSASTVGSSAGLLVADLGLHHRLLHRRRRLRLRVGVQVDAHRRLAADAAWAGRVHHQTLGVFSATARGARRDRRRRRAVDVARPLEEGVDHAPHRLVEHHADRRLQDAAAELEIDEEIHLGSRCACGDEAPLVVQIAERAVLVAHVDQLRPVQRDAAGEALAEQAEADDQVGDQLGLGARCARGRRRTRAGTAGTCRHRRPDRTAARACTAGPASRRGSASGGGDALARRAAVAQRARNPRRRDRNCGSAAWRRPAGTPWPAPAARSPRTPPA